MDPLSFSICILIHCFSLFMFESLKQFKIECWFVFFSLEFFFCGCISHTYCIEFATLSKFESVTSSKGTQVVQFSVTFLCQGTNLSRFFNPGLFMFYALNRGCWGEGLKFVTILQFVKYF